ncbi:MAG: ABC transporter substrate-binding protein [Pseudorhodoplanes sp.]|uniref:ABC transporter substrate-binding protein n=1 Tax=Pseudorhodoplanes sp. TaxID=1934341 RepID=UPI003D0C5183
MRRRTFLASTVIVSAWSLIWAGGARAQQAKVPVLGVLALGNPPPDNFLRALRAGLQQLGYGEGRNIRLEIRNAEGSADRLAGQAAELVAAKADVIVAYQTPAATAAKEATSDIPVVFAATGDPLGTGLIASYARPGGNLTGTTAGAVEVAGKTVELIRELLPAARRIAVLANQTDPFTKPYLAEIRRVAGIMKLEVLPVMVRPSEPLDAAFATIVADRAEALVIQGSLVRKDAVELATRHRLPTVGSPHILPRLGGLMSYSADFDAMMRETAGHIDKILKGAKPAELPVTFPSAFEMIVNLNAAKALGITIPEAFMQRANEVIE